MLHPYSWTFDGISNAYTFHTEKGIKYQVAFYGVGNIHFSEYPDIANLLYEISFTPDPDSQYNGKDNKVSMTVVDIVQTVLRNGKVIMFICDSIDGREKARNKLFGTWFAKHGSGFEKQDMEILTDDCNYYYSLIVAANHPNKSTILKAFEQANDEYSACKNTP